MKNKNTTASVLLDTYWSLVDACAKAGGDAPIPARLQTMTAMELIDHIAPNGIRFCYDTEDAL
jgi:hypothetical protein